MMNVFIQSTLPHPRKEPKEAPQMDTGEWDRDGGGFLTGLGYDLVP